ncbi:FtsK/SpoIIIE family DNA translocase [Desulfocicer niacini]
MKKELSNILLFFFFIFLGLSLVSYSPLPSLRYYHSFQSDPVHNLFGTLGAGVSGILVGLFGVGALYIPLSLAGAFFVHARKPSRGVMGLMLGGGLVFTMSLGCFLALFRDGYSFWGTYYSAGGVLGDWVTRWLIQCLNVSGAVIVLVFLMLLGLVLSTNLSFVALIHIVVRGSAQFFWYMRQGLAGLTGVVHATGMLLGRILCERQDAQRGGLSRGLVSFTGPVMGDERLSGSLSLTKTPSHPRQIPDTSHAENPVSPGKKNQKSAMIVARPPAAACEAVATPPGESLERMGFILPSVALLNERKATHTRVDGDALREKGQILENKLKDFGIAGEVVEILPGPVITTFEYRPAPGVKISKIVNLTDDLALALSALSIRIIAPIPGKDVVGVEIPNDIRENVVIREMLSAPVFVESDSRMSLGLGRDILGVPVVARMETMPHLLIAGATGTGKSVGLNAMIISLLYKATPEEVKFIMVDPKRIELSVYDGIPHLISPVVTDMKKATNALYWAVGEMERRYELLADNGVRNLLQYNQLVDKQLQEGLKKGARVSGDEEEITAADPEAIVPEKLPYIVVIVDEFADLMMVASRDVESALIRLAQMARAAGIHLILATQRPSVDVLTGVIKANFPTRISFQVSSKVDSRTILDTNGAETLLGNGDMLFMPPGTGRLTRIQGAYISEGEIARVTTFLKEQRSPVYVEEVTQKTDASPGDGSDADYDEKYDEAVALVTRTRTASISSVQRHLRIGYNRAARIIETMESQGIIGPQEGSKPREILVKSFEA